MPRTSIAVAAAALALAVLTTPPAGAAPPVPSTWRGDVRGTVYGQPFRLAATVELKRPRRGERNPFNLFAGTTAPPATNVGSVLLTSAQVIVTPYTGRRATLRYLCVRSTGNRVSALLVDTHRAEAAAINGFTAPNVCRSVYTEFECVLPGPELFAFDRRATLSLRIAGRRMTGTIRGTGTGLTQVLPYPEVRYEGTLSLRRRR